MTRVRIGIVSWNTAQLLDRCLAALPAAAASLGVDVVVVDNNSTDGSVEVARRHPHVVVIENKENVGYARAMNQALRHAGDGPPPDVLIALNPDTSPAPHSLTDLVCRLQEDPTVGLVVPRLSNADGSPQHSVYRFPSVLITIILCTVPVRLQQGWAARRFWLEGAPQPDAACDIDWAIGAVHVIRASALDSQPPYSERWFMYVEDLDLCWRLHQAGWHCRLEPSVDIVHVGNAAGVQAWGDLRSVRWWEATYDWYRLRRGVRAARGWARANTLGTMALWFLARLRFRILGERASALTKSRLAELHAVLPIHRAMWRDPRGAYRPDGAGAPTTRNP